MDARLQVIWWAVSALSIWVVRHFGQPDRSHDAWGTRPRTRFMLWLQSDLPAIAIRLIPYAVAYFAVSLLAEELLAPWNSGMPGWAGPAVLATWSLLLMSVLTLGPIIRGRRHAQEVQPNQHIQYMGNAFMLQLCAGAVAVASAIMARWIHGLADADVNPYWILLLVAVGFSTVVCVLLAIILIQWFRLADARSEAIGSSVRSIDEMDVVSDRAAS